MLGKLSLIMSEISAAALLCAVWAMLREEGLFFATLPDLLETKLLQQDWERDHIMLVEQIDRGYYYRTSAASLDDRSRRRPERRRILISIIKMGSALEWVWPYFLLLQHCTNNELKNVWRKVYWKLHHMLETVMRVTWFSSYSTLFPWFFCYIFHLKVVQDCSRKTFQNNKDTFRESW